MNAKQIADAIAEHDRERFSEPWCEDYRREVAGIIERHLGLVYKRLADEIERLHQLLARKNQALDVFASARMWLPPDQDCNDWAWLGADVYKDPAAFAAKERDNAEPFDSIGSVTHTAPCTHNRMVMTDDPNHAWKCADCGYVYGHKAGGTP